MRDESVYHVTLNIMASHKIEIKIKFYGRNVLKRNSNLELDIILELLNVIILQRILLLYGDTF